MKRYRIVKVGDVYHVQEKCLWWWKTWICGCDFMVSDTPCEYKSSEEAKKYIQKRQSESVEEIVEYV